MSVSESVMAGISRQRWLVEGVSRVHRELFTRTDGRFGSRLGRMRILMLTTTGRKSGQPRSTPLTYVEDGDRMALAGSNFGSSKPPAWLLNLQAQPEAEARMGKRVVHVRAREATPEEAERIWPRFVAVYPYYEGYKKVAGRHIPIMLLEPRSQA